MTTTFSVEFSDDFTDHVREIAEEAVSNIDFSDHASSMFGGLDDPDDYFDMSNYLTDDLERQVEECGEQVDTLTEQVEALTKQVEAMKQAMVALVTALAGAGITAVTQVTHKEEGN